MLSSISELRILPVYHWFSLFRIFHDHSQYYEPSVIWNHIVSFSNQHNSLFHYSTKIPLEKMSQNIIALPMVTVMATFAIFDAVQKAKQFLRIILSAYSDSLLQMNKQNEISNHNQV